MRLDLTRCTRPWAVAGAAAAILSLAGCGGGGGGGTSTPPTAQSLSGVVIDGPIKGATVCLDLNKNGACDATEPVSSATDAQGNYTISGLTAEQVNSGAPLVAVIPATAVDADNPTVTVGTAYRLSAPAGKGALISPVTTLVQTGVGQGMTLAASESAVAAQLQVNAANLYNNYSASSGGDNATLTTFVPGIVASLQRGETLVVGTPTAPAPGYWVVSMSFAGSSSYMLRFHYSTNVPDSTGTSTFYDERTEIVGGTPLPASRVYNFGYLYATPQGWKTFDGAAANTSTSGSPHVTTWAHGHKYTSTYVEMDVGGQSIASVVALAQDTTVNTSSSLVGINASKLGGTMPAGAKLRRVTTRTTAAPIQYYEPLGAVGSGVTAVAGLASAFPVPASPTESNTVSMGYLHGCSSGPCPQSAVRAAFGSGKSATIYLCDFNTTTGAEANCGAVGTATYSLGTAVDGNTPIMTFDGLPAATSEQTATRVFVERRGGVYLGSRDKVTTVGSTRTRLNKVAFEALATALGIPAPAISDTPSAYAGTWSASYAGSDTGSCADISIDALGRLSGSCTSTTVGGTFVVSGTVGSAGAVTFTASGSTSSGAVFSGSLGTASGSGSWTQASTGRSGTWSATKQ